MTRQVGLDPGCHGEVLTWQLRLGGGHWFAGQSVVSDAMLEVGGTIARNSDARRAKRHAGGLRPGPARGLGERQCREWQFRSGVVTSVPARVPNRDVESV